MKENQRLVQIMGEGVEELYYFPSNILDVEISALWEGWKYNQDSTFEEFCESSEVKCERVFVDEIYVD